MDEDTLSATWAEIADRVREAGRVAVVTHRRPDGDALGCVLALARALPSVGAGVDAFLMGGIDPALVGVIRDTPWRSADEEQPGDDYELIIVVDTGAWAQLEPIKGWLRRHHERVVVIDHHVHGDGVAALGVVEPTAAATAVLVTALLDELGCPLTEAIAEALFVGLATDTGWFRYANANAEAFRLAARLIDVGVDRAGLFQRLEETHRPERLRLEARALASVEYERKETVAIMALTVEDFRDTGGSIHDLTGLVNRPMIVDRVRASILLAEIEPSMTKISLRAKESAGAGAEVIDVNALARRLGGGGHVLAAGARMAADLAEARRAVLRALEQGSGSGC